MSLIKIALPNGHLQQEVQNLLISAGFTVNGYEKESRGYRPTFQEQQITAKVFRPQEIPLIVAEGYYDIGITGLDWFEESLCENNVIELLDLGLGRVDVVLAVPTIWEQVKSVQDLVQLPREQIRIWTEYLNLASSFIYKKTEVDCSIRTPWESIHRGIWSKVHLFLSFGVTEAKPPEDAEAIIDNTSTGTTLRANGLKIIDTILKNSTARLIANRISFQHPEKRKSILDFESKLQKVVPSKRRDVLTPRFGHL